MSKTINVNKQKPADFSSLAESWPSSYVSRNEIERFSGGAIRAKTISNLDSKGAGIPGRIRCGRKIIYKVENVIRYLESRSALVD